MQLIVHTDTTGLWNFKEQTAWHGQPHMIRLAMLLIAGDQVIERFCELVQPLEGWTIEHGAARFHGIGIGLAQKIGKPLDDIVLTLQSWANRADSYVAWGSAYQSKVLHRAAIDVDRMLVLPPAICAQGLARNALRTPAAAPMPKIAVAHGAMTGSTYALPADPVEAGHYTVAAIHHIYQAATAEAPRAQAG